MKPNRQLLPFLSFAALCLILSSCSRVYVPSSHNAPLLGREGETRLNASVGTHGLDVQAAHAVTNEIGVIGGGSFSFGGQRITSHQYIEAGAGGFTSLRPSWLGPSVFRAEGYIGTGFGRSAGITSWTIDDVTVEQRVPSTMWKPFVQGNIGVSQSQFDAGLSTRLAYLNHQIGTVRDVPIPTNLDTDTWLLEPALFFRYAWEDFYFQGQIGSSVPLVESNIDVQPVTFSVGIQYRLFKGIPDVPGRWENTNVEEWEY